MDKLPWASEVGTSVKPYHPRIKLSFPREGIMISLSNSRPIMAIFSGNLISKTAIQLQSQVFLIPWVKKKMKMGSISCSKRRDYSSSVPVRYIPKKSLENKESEASSSLPHANLLDDVGKNNISLESNGKRVELSSSVQTSCGSRSFVPDGKFRNRNEKPIGNVNCNVGLDRSRVVQSNVERIELSKSAQTSCRTGSFIADTEFENKTRDDKTISGLGTVRVVGSNVEGSELSDAAQTSCHSRSFIVDDEFQSQNGKPINNVNHGFGLVTTRVVESNVDRSELSNSALTSCSGRSFGFGTEFQNQNEKPIDSINSDFVSYSSRVVRSNVQRSELSKSAQTSCSSRTFAGETKFQNQTEKPISSINNDVRLATSRLVQPNEQRVELSNSTQTSCSSQSFVVDSKFQNRYYKRIDYDFGLGVGEELDGHLQYECYEITEELEGFLEEESNQDQEIQGFRIKQDVEKLAVELLATRAFTAVELRRKLLGKKFPVGVVDAVIMDFQGRGLINDGLYAETFSRSRWSSSTWGPRRIKKALYSKGVSDMDAEKAIKLVFNDAAASGDEESGLGMSKLSMDHLFAQASKQWLRSCGVSRETRKTRIIRWLQYRGFSWSIISFVLKKLESQYPS